LEVEEGIVWSKEASIAWYYRLDVYLQQGFRKGNVDNNLYIKVIQYSILLIEVYLDDIIFGSDDDKLRRKFAKDMKNEFEMSLLGDLSLFLGPILIFGSSDMSKKLRHFFFSNQVYQRNDKEVWNGRFQTNQYSYTKNLQVK
jgi:hypothetical protein